MANKVALNTIGHRYDADAVMIGRAFDYASRHAMREFSDRVAEYVYDYALDRRFKVSWRAASSDFASAIIRYRNRRLYVEGVYDPETKRRTYYVYPA